MPGCAITCCCGSVYCDVVADGAGGWLAVMLMCSQAGRLRRAVLAPCTQQQQHWPASERALIVQTASRSACVRASPPRSGHYHSDDSLRQLISSCTRAATSITTDRTCLTVSRCRDSIAVCLSLVLLLQLLLMARRQLNRVSTAARHDWEILVTAV